MGMKVHITGGEGFLGQYIARSLEGHEVVVSDVGTLDVCDQQAVVDRFAAWGRGWR